MSAQLYAFFGQAAGNDLFLWGTATDDDGVPITLLAQSAPVVSDTIGMALALRAVYLGLTWSMACTLRVTPLVNGVAWDGTGGTPDCRREITLSASTERQTQVVEVVMSRALVDPIDPSIELARVYLRGQSFALRIASVGGLSEGDVILDRCDLELEDVIETLTPEG